MTKKHPIETISHDVFKELLKQRLPVDTSWNNIYVEKDNDELKIEFFYDAWSDKICVVAYEYNSGREAKHWDRVEIDEIISFVRGWLEQA